MVELHVLRSSLFDGFYYDESQRALRLVMKNGQFRDFVDVPDYIVKDLTTVKSPGSYYIEYIRDKFPAG